ncbi:hypothetical protein GCM10023155_46650 [Bremerella cremea]
MEQRVKTNHPRSTFCFYASGRNLSDDLWHQMRTVVTTLSKSRTWVIGPPTLADENDGEVRWIGGSLEIYTALPPFGADLPKDVDRRHLEEVTAIVDAMTKLSGQTDLEISFTLDQTYVGRIKGGKPDSMIQVGLLGEWKKALGIA